MWRPTKPPILPRTSRRSSKAPALRSALPVHRSSARKSARSVRKRLVPALATPGEMLVEEFLKPLGLTEYRLAKDIGVPPRRINEIVHGKRAITTDTAFRLSQYFGNSSQFWLNLQADYELRRMERAGELPKI